MDAGVASIVVAIIGGSVGMSKVLADLAKVKKQVTPSNGVPTAEMVEGLKKDVRQIKQDLSYHVTVQHGRGPVSDEEGSHE